VLRTDSTLLYDRLVARKYAARKIEENMDAEIMQVLLEEARGAYDGEIVVELRSDEVGDLDKNVERMAEWVKRWMKEREEDKDDEDDGE
jgi:adenylate kinase